MKKNSLLLIAFLAVLATSASAAQNQPQSDVLVLPTYVVAVPRYLPVERQINASLNELRQQARTPAVITTELPALKAQIARGSGVSHAGQDAKSPRIAKL